MSAINDLAAMTQAHPEYLDQIPPAEADLARLLLIKGNNCPQPSGDRAATLKPEGSKKLKAKNRTDLGAQNGKNSSSFV